MIKPKTRRLYMLSALLLGFGGATALALVGFSSSLTYFLSPRQVAAHAPPAGETFRLGGIVEAGTVQTTQTGESLTTRFDVTDGQAAVPVIYTGILPDLFGVGQGVVTIGALEPDGAFHAEEVLAKHGSTYMPRDVAQSLKDAGKWNPKFGPAPGPDALGSPS
ncbi:cytochrome c maturation protein CcmE [Acidocella sp.]|jgi:cytochrome c-type biogenesis protein CcmE|uniref:cytochrome c maturation protein CcmE n=1 Tax=Acidocella sp. TaxID=50710 RepID=UPI00262F4FFF|nr:cytochrome c maturation protein CcmE [Acidocella sp.]